MIDQYTRIWGRKPRVKRATVYRPQVFFAADEHQAIISQKKRILRDHGFEGIDPLDTDPVFAGHEPKRDRPVITVTFQVMCSGIAYSDYSVFVESPARLSSTAFAAIRAGRLSNLAT